MPALDPLALTELRRRLREEIGFVSCDVTEILAGGNNRLFRIASDDGQVVLAKFYVADYRPRLATEFGAVSYLRERGFTNVPRALLRDDALSYAVYSFEPGQTKPAAAFAPNDLLPLARFLADLHLLQRDVTSATFGWTPVASFSLAEPLVRITQIVRSFEAYAAAADAADAIRDLARDTDLESVIATLTRRATSGLTPDDLAKTLPEEDWRLSPGDFGPHNLLVTPEGRICVVDFEYFGWDDPARSVMDFVCHDATIDLAPELAALFVREYARMRNLPEAEVLRFERVRALLDVEWLTIHLRAIMPAVIARRTFANTAFDVNQHLSEQIGKFRRRLALVEERTQWT